MIRETALFETLNAKKLSNAEIAASFVVPAQYDQLVGTDHAYLIGPRGSGKTTLLRMLQGQSLVGWDHPRADHYRSRIRYSSVFLPADRLWESQLADSRVGVAAFTTQMLYALVETMLYRLGDTEEGPVLHPAKLRHLSEVELVAECAEAWALRLRSPSLRGLLGALDLRLHSIASFIESESSPGSIQSESWLSLPTIYSFQFGIRAFNRHAGQPDHRWALLLDEMELAPPHVHQQLRQSLRGGERSHILKLSFSPFDRYISSREQDAGEAYPDNDFKAIYLWYGSRIGSRKFTRGLWHRMMSETFSAAKSPNAVLGQSEIDVSGATWRAQGYRRNSKQMKLLTQMKRQDYAFRDYLVHKRIDLRTIDTMSYDEKSATIRKVYPLLVFRDAVLRFEGGVGKRRQRKKVTECFTGADAVSAALEGNPRWVKAVFSKLLSAYDGAKVRPGFQYDTLKESAERFEALLRILPSASQDGRTVLDLINDIAAYFSARAFGIFSPEPPAVFRVDDQVSDGIIETLTIALSAGAVVHLRGRHSPVVLNDLRGERFRIAYLLAIRDGREIPMRLSKTTNLSSILTWCETQKRQAGRRPNSPPVLWDEEELP
jgi:hypothetical protein